MCGRLDGKGLHVGKPKKPAQGDGKELRDLGQVTKTLALVVSFQNEVL